MKAEVQKVFVVTFKEGIIGIRKSRKSALALLNEANRWNNFEKLTICECDLLD